MTSECFPMSTIFLCFIMGLFSLSAFAAPSLDSVIATMQHPSELTLLSNPNHLAPQGSVIMGGAPRGDATPWWWKPSDTAAYKSAEVWNCVIPWFVIMPGISNEATNIRIKINNITIYTLSASTNSWTLVSSGNCTWADKYTPGSGEVACGSFVGKADTRIEPDGHVSYKISSDAPVIHGGLAKYAINGSDIKSMYVHITTELILDNPSGPDDREVAQIGLQAGADWYPETTTETSDFAPMDYNPGIGSGRWQVVTIALRYHYMTPIDPPGNRDNPHSPYQQSGGVIAITETEFRSNPPPCIPTTSIRIGETRQANITVTNYPNPFSAGGRSAHGGNPSTTIEYSIQKSGFISLTVCDLLGREVTKLVNEYKIAGTYRTSWNGRGMPSGIYFYRIKADSFTETKRLVLLQ